MADFHKELIEKLTNPKKQKPYKESSVKPVYGYLKQLNGGVPPTSLDFLLERPIVMKFLEKYAVNTQRTIVFAIRNVAKDFDRDDILEVWKGNIEETEAGKGLPEKGEKSEAQEKAYALLEGEDKGSAWDKVKSKVNKNKADKGELDYIIPHLYTDFPPRRNLDYTEMKVVEGESVEGLSKEFNYVVITDKTTFDGHKRKELHFVFNRYKTDGNYKQQIFSVDGDLYYELRDYIKEKGKKNGDYLLTKPSGKPLRSDDITESLHRVIGSGVSSQMLRHMFLDKYNTPKFERIIREMFGDAEMMAHSVSTQQNTYVKK